jgi:hypothetical protein
MQVTDDRNRIVDEGTKVGGEDVKVLHQRHEGGTDRASCAAPAAGGSPRDHPVGKA